MPNKTVWIINHYAQTPINFGGTRHFNLAKYLPKYGWNAIIVACSTEINTSQQLISDGKNYQSQEVDGVSFLRIKSNSYKKNGIGRLINMLLFSIRTLFPWYTQSLPRPDVIIGSTVHPFAAFAGYILSKRYKIPFLYEVRDLWPQTLIDMGHLKEKSIATKVFSFIESLLAKKANQIISLLPDTSTYFAKFGIDGNKIVWIPNGIDFQEFPLLPQKPQNDHFNFYYFGAHGKANYLDNLLEAMEILNNQPQYSHIFLTLIGDGPEKEYLKRKASELKLTNTHFLAPVTKREIATLCQQADAFVFNLAYLPVFQYGISSNKLFDYMAGAKPIIFCCEAKNNPIADACCGITVKPNNPEALANALIQLSSIPVPDRKKMGEAARAYVEENHNFEKLAQTLSQTLNKVSNIKN